MNRPRVLTAMVLTFNASMGFVTVYRWETHSHLFRGDLAVSLGAALVLGWCLGMRWLYGSESA